MKADGGVKWINSNIIKHKKEFKKKGYVENCGASRGFGFIYIYIDNNNNNNSSSSSNN